MLTDAKIRALKPNAKKYKVSDERGSYLLVKPNGAKLWRFKYAINGIEKLISLGIYDDVSLKHAREKRDAARKLVAAGIDPSAERKAAKIAQADTFKVIAEEWLEVKGKALAPKTYSRVHTWLTERLYPAFGSRPFNGIEAAALLAVVRRAEASNKFETARRLRTLYGTIARYAMATGKAQRDISQDLRGALAPITTEHLAAITEPRRIGELLRAIDGYSGQPSTMYALRVAPHVFVRPGELRGARWAEFDLDGKEPLWRVPASRMKAGAEHVVPLSRQIVELLEELQALTGDGELLFPGLRAPSRPISNNTLNASLRRIGFTQREMTAHGFRTLASTRLNEMGVNSDLIELQLAHAERDEVRGAYNRASRLPERRRMMQKWSDTLDKLRAAK